MFHQLTVTWQSTPTLEASPPTIHSSHAKTWYYFTLLGSQHTVVQHKRMFLSNVLVCHYITATDLFNNIR